MPNNNKLLTPPAINDNRGVSDYFNTVRNAYQERARVFEFENSLGRNNDIVERWAEKRKRDLRTNNTRRLRRQADLEYFRKVRQHAERIRRLEEEKQKEEDERLKQEAREADEIEERDFQKWSEGKWWKDNFVGRRLWDIKNMLGSLATSSIDTNGLNILSRISLNELRKRSADAYNEMLETEEDLRRIDAALDLDPFNQRLINESIDAYNKLNSPELTGLVDAYKQYYVLDRKNFGQQFMHGLGNAIEEAITYDPYKSQVRAKNKQELLNEFDNLVNDEISNIMSTEYHALRNQDQYNKIRNDARRRMIDRTKSKADADNIELSKEYEQNRTHLQESEEYWNVSEGFKKNIQVHANDKVWNPYYWKYEMPPMIGSSVSSPNQAIATGIKGVGTIAGLALAPFSEGASLNLLWISELAATPFDWESAKDENYMETGEKRLDSIINLLKDPSITKDLDIFENTTYDTVMKELKSRSEAVWKARGWKKEWIDKHLYGDNGDKNAISDYIAGITNNSAINTNKDDRNDSSKQIKFGEFMHPAFQDALLFSTAGLQAQYDADMMRTAGEIPFLKAMALIPTKWLNFGGRVFDRALQKVEKKIVSNIERDAEGNLFAKAANTAEEVAEHGAELAARTKYVNNFNRQHRTFRQAVQHGYGVGASAAEMTGFGFAGHVAGGFVGAAAEGLAHGARKMLNPRLSRLVAGLEEKAAIKYQAAIDKLTPDRLWQKALLEYGIKATKRNVAIGMSEAAEEAVQYLNSKEDFASKYKWSGMSLADMVSNDLMLGGRVLDSYLALFGIGSSPLLDDEEYWLNVKGGFMLGGLPLANPSAMIQTVGNTIHGYKEYKTQDALLSSGVMSREYDNINRAATAEFARQAFQGHEAHVINAINEMEASDRRREEPFFTQEDYEQRKKDAQVVMAMTKNKNIRQMLEAKGIQYGTERYATAISDLYTMQELLKNNDEQTRQNNAELDKIYNSQVFLIAVKNIVDDVANNSVGDKEQIDADVKKAGDDAVIREIDAIRSELNLEPGSKKYEREINKAENRQRIVDAREQAEEAVRAEIIQHFTNVTIAKTRIANRLMGLLDLKSRHNTIESFYDFLHDKFNLSTMRPDAKVIRENIDEQIKESKKQLAQITEGTSDSFNENSTDVNTLDYLQSILDVVHTRELDAQQLEAVAAMLSADKAVTLSYYNLFTEGLIKNKDDKWEYNLAEFNARNARNKQLADLLRKGDTEGIKKLSEAKPEPIETEENDVKNNSYGRRIDAIMEANLRNQALKWAINEVANGDAVNKMMDILRDEQLNAQQRAMNKEQNVKSIVDKAERDPFAVYDDDADQQTEQLPTTTQTKLPEEDNSKIKSKYERRRQKVKDFFNRQRKKYKDFSKGSLQAGIPFLNIIVKGAYDLAENAALGVLKFSEFVELMRELLPEASINDILPSIKAGYNKRRVYFSLNKPEVVDNMSSSEEVMNYSTGPVDDVVVTVTPPPSPKPFHQKIQKIINDKLNRIIDDVSSHYDIFVEDPDGVHIYHNVESLKHSELKSTDYHVQALSKKLQDANTSDESFRNAINSIPNLIADFPVETYVKYRDVEGVEDAVARKHFTSIPNKYIVNGIKVQNAVVSILSGREDLLNSENFPSGFEQFKQDVLDLRKSLSDIKVTVLDVGKYIYGIDESGNRIAAQADIIAAREDGSVYVIDVRSSYRSIRKNWDKPISNRISYTILELVYDQMKSIKDIINNSFKFPVSGVYNLPIVYNQYEFFIEKSDDGDLLIPIKIVTDDHNEEIDQSKERSEKLVQEINSRIDEYNLFVEESLKYTLKYAKIPHIIPSVYTTDQDYATYIGQLTVQYDDLQSRIDDMKQEILDNIDAENQIWLENADYNTQYIPEPEISMYISRLEECCKDLDIVLQYIPQTKATTQKEKDDVRTLYQSIFDAQKALDAVLQHQEASNINVQDEAELIARAMEVLAENKENFGAMSMFMRRWWANNFVIGVGNNTTQGVGNIMLQSYGFVNAINTWINTLLDHVLNQLDGHDALQEWYSSILNNYFAKLLNNAEAFAELQDPTYASAVRQLIAKGKQLIVDFNETWGVDPDENFSGPPANDVERIKRMSTKWKDLYSTSTSHAPAIDAMSNSSLYYVMSINPTFIQGYKTQLSLKDDSDDKSTRFILFKNDRGEVMLRINWWDGKRWTTLDMPFQTDISKYRNATEQEIQRLISINRGNKKFTKKVGEMLNYIEKHPEYTIDFTVKLNKGSIRYGSTEEHRNVSEFLFKGAGNQHDMYTVSLSAKDRIGIGVFITDIYSGRRFYDVCAGKNLKTRIGGFDDTYIKLHLNTQNGAVIYFYDYGNGDQIGVPLQTSKIGTATATNLVDLISRYVAGERMYDGYDIESLLNLRLYIYNPFRLLSAYNNRNNLITINKDGNVVIGNETYNVFTNKQGLIDRISAMNNATSAEMMNENMASSDDPVLQSLRQRFASDSNLKLITLPNGLIINREDFTHQNADGSRGSTWLGYLLRNNILGTRATSRSYRQVNIDNLDLINKNSVSPRIQINDANDRKESRRRRLSSLDAIDPFIAAEGGLTMTNDNEDIDYNRGSEEQEDFVNAVKEYFKNVFGTDKDLLFEDTVNKYIVTASRNQRIIGLTTSEMVKLSKYAPYTAMYHEAFHKLLELVLPSNVREDFYTIYRSRNGEDLTDRLVAEGLADLFVGYMSKYILPKDAKWYNKIFKWFKVAGYALNMCWNYGIVNTRKMYTVYQNMNAGKYANVEISKEASDRFKKLFGDELYYNVNGVEFQHIADSGQLHQIVKALGYYILTAYGVDMVNPEIKFTIDEFTPNILPKDVLDDLTALGIPDDELTAVDLAFREILKSKTVPVKGTKGKQKDKIIGYKKSYPNFKAIRKNLSDYIETLLGQRGGRIEDEEDSEEDAGDNRNVQMMNIDRFDRASYEFSKLDSLNRKVKLFFSTIPYCTFDEDGKIVLDYSKNEFNCPSFQSIDEVYNVIVNDLHTVKDVNELEDAFEKLSKYHPMYRYVYNKYHSLVKDIYKRDDDNNVILIDYDKESFAIQILNAIRSQKIDFVVALSERDRDSGDKEVRITSSSLERDAKLFPKQWSLFLIAGQVSIFSRNRDASGNFVFKSGMGGKDNTDIFSRIAFFISELRQALSQSSDLITVEGVEYNKKSLEAVAKIKSNIIQKLHSIGIIFSYDALDHMLLTEYGNMGSDGLLSWLTQSGTSSINTFIDTLNNFVRKDGVVNKSLVEKGYSGIGFVRNLAKWQGAYNRIHILLMALALNGKRLYSVSQNDSISNIIDALNTGDLDNDTISTLMNFEYNVTRTDFPQGSIILKAIKQREDLHIRAHTYIGFKTDNRGDSGSEYTKEATVDDYISKLAMLQQGYLIFPTLADKSSYRILDGIKIPGMTFLKVKKNKDDENNENEYEDNSEQNNITVVKGAPHIKFINGTPYIIPSDAVLNQMIEYANTERLAIQQCMEDLGYNNIPGYTKQGRTKLSEKAKILNYHTPNVDKKTKKVVEPNGTRFLSLTSIVCKEILDGKVVLNTYNLNDPNKSSVDLLKLANEHFFNKGLEELKEIMALTLAIQAGHEINKAIELGLVERQNVSAKWTDVRGKVVDVSIHKDDVSLMNLQTKHLNETLISALTTEILRTTSHRDYGNWLNIPRETNDQNVEKAFKYKIARSFAIASLLADATYRSIICSQELHRCFIGHPAEFKVDYDFKNGKIKDSTYDIQKRIGGLISTGDDNVLDLPGIPSTYTCAECKDYEVSSSSDVAKDLKDMFLTSEVREAFCNSMFLLRSKKPNIFGSWLMNYDKDSYYELISDNKETERFIYKIAYNSDVKHLMEIAPKDILSSLKKALRDADKFSSAYDKGINVADGAAYITDTMCENMLRMRGAYNEDVKKAFDILRSDDTKYSWVDKQDAYNIIYSIPSLVTTKYTAYGFRKHTWNDEEVSDISVAYYNKFALFPIFPCLATGKMAGVYKKMLDEKVDMLLMTSAVKVGSQGAVEYDGEKFSSTFNKYTQSFGYLRRQLNTDPEEGDRIMAGSLMIKIGLQNLRLGRTYKHARTGQDITGQELLDTFMNSIKILAQSGKYELQNMFLDPESGEVDPDKLSKYLKDQLSSRNASKSTIESIQVVTDPVTNQKRLVCPLAATPDARWIESILISTINRHIIDIITPGASFVQRSVFAMEGSSVSGGKIQSDADMSPTINGGKKLQMLNEDGSMDAVISIDYFDSLFEGKLRNMSFNEKRQWLIDNNIIGPNAMANTIGYRIPTQSQSSIHALRFVDVISAVKSTIILPEEFTKITGSDFDIDHLYLASYNYNVMIAEDGIQYATTQFNPVEDDGRYSDKYHQNNIIDCLMTLLKDSDNSISSLYKSIDNDTEIPKSIADQIEDDESTKADPYNFGTLHEQVDRKNDYITGKTGIGPFALNVTNQILTMLYGVKFKSTKFTNSTGIKRLDHIVDDEGNAISAWLSAFINGHVDIVKDTWVSKLNVNPFTYNMLNLLVRSGFGDVSVWFLTQPIIKDMAKASQLARSQYARDLEKTRSTFAAQEYAIMLAVEKYIPSEEARSASVINMYTHSNEPAAVDARINVVKWVKEHEDVLSWFAKHPDSTEVVIDNFVYYRDDVQKQVFYAWKALEKYSIALSNLVQHTKIDTRKHGKSLIAIQQYLDAYDKIVNDPNPSESLWDIESIRNLVNNSWIDFKTREAISAPQFILKNQTFTANPLFINAIIGFGNTLSTTGGVLDVKTLSFLSQCLITAIKSKYMAKYAKEKLGKSDSDIAKLFVGSRNMNKRLTMLKNAIETNPEYNRLRNNHLINQIYSEDDLNEILVRGKLAERPSFITVLSNVDDSKTNSDLLIDGWEDLLNDKDKFVRQFARDLIVYSFFTSGEFQGWNKLFKYVPPAWIRGEIDTDIQSFSEYIQKELTANSFNYKDLLDDIVSNNFMDHRLAKRIPLVNKEDNTNNFIDVTSIIKIGKPVNLNQVYSCEKYITINESNYSSKGVSGYNLYKLQGFIGGSNGYHPIYARLKKRGYHDGSMNDIYEYYWLFGYAENENEAFVAFDNAAALNRVKAAIDEFSQDGNLYDEASAKAITDVYLGRTDAISTRTDDGVKSDTDAIAVKKHQGDWSRAEAQANPRILYVFTDNVDRDSGSGVISDDSWYSKRYGIGHHYPSSTAAVIRGLDNARPISTMHYFYKTHGFAYPKYDRTSKALWHDSDIEEFSTVIRLELLDIVDEFNTGKYDTIMFPDGDGLFNTELSNITKTRTPKLYAELVNMLHEYGFDALIPKDADRTSMPTAMNIWWGRGKDDPQHENGDLSNFAERPFNFDDEHFNSVEQAFQRYKLTRLTDNYDRKSAEDSYNEIMNATSPSSIKNAGRNIKDLDVESWDRYSPVIMKQLIKASFELNPQALQKLLDTGDAVLTHTQDKGKWGKEFPRLLMEVRDELRDEKGNNTIDAEALEVGRETVIGTIQSMESNTNPEFTEGDKNIRRIIGNNPLKVVMASEHTDPAFHSREVCKKINEDRKLPKGLRKYHMLQIMTKHDGLPLLNMLELDIPKTVHFSITGLGGTKWEPGVMKPDDLLDRIQDLIEQGKLNPSLTTVRIDPIIPGVTTPKMIKHIIERASRMGIKSFKVSIMDSYSYNDTEKWRRGVYERMTKLGYDFSKYYIQYANGNFSQDVKPEIMKSIYERIDEIAQQYGVRMSTCGEKPANVNVKNISFSHGCLNAHTVAKVLGTTEAEVDRISEEGRLRPGKCHCLNNKEDILDYDDVCYSQCAYCYARHGSKGAYKYYNEDGTLKHNGLTMTRHPKDVIKNVESSEEFYTKQDMLDYVNDLVNIDGIDRSNIDVKHFKETEDTDEYWVVSVNNSNNKPAKIQTLSTADNPLLIYSDGSDIKGTGSIGYGAVFEYNGKFYGISGTETGEEVEKLKLRFPDAKFSNPTMEMLALTTVLEHVAQTGKAEHIEINQDYKGAVNYNGLWQYSEGSNQRAEKPWKAKELYIAHLVERSEAAIKQIIDNGGSVKIRWVKGHQSGTSNQARMNNAADSYAKNRNNFNNFDEAYEQSSDQNIFNNPKEFLPKYKDSCGN